jgi:plasmid stabilization system protein ParE
VSNDIDFRSEAENELRQAFEWYESQQEGLGESFLARVEVALQRMSTFPQSAPIVYRDVRRLLLDRFPHSILYIFESGRIVVLAVYHGRRDPKSWKDRG